MMGRLKSDQGQLFYEFHLGDAVPEDHLVRRIDTALDLSWLRSELAPHYSSMGRPSIDPELMIRMGQSTQNDEIVTFELQAHLLHLSGKGSPHLRPERFDKLYLVAKRHEYFSKLMDVFCTHRPPTVWKAATRAASGLCEGCCD